VVEAGGAIVEVVEQGSSSGPSDDSDLAGWVSAYGLEISTVRPKDGMTTEQLEGREHTYIIDLSSNLIVFEGYGGGGLEDALDEIQLLLGS